MGVSNRWPSSISELISRMEMRLRAPVTRGYFFLRLVNAASPRSIDQKKISSGTQGMWNTRKTKIIIDSKLPCICATILFSTEDTKIWWEYLWEKLTALCHFVICDWQYWSWGVLSKINRHVCHIHNSQDIVFDIFNTMSFWWRAIGTEYQYWQNCEHFL